MAKVTEAKVATKLGAKVIASVAIGTNTNKVKLGQVVRFGKCTNSVSYTHKGTLTVSPNVKHDNILYVSSKFRALKKPRVGCSAHIPIKNRLLLGTVTKVTPHQVHVYVAPIGTTFRYAKESCIFTK